MMLTSVILVGCSLQVEKQNAVPDKEYEIHQDTKKAAHREHCRRKSIIQTTHSKTDSVTQQLAIIKPATDLSRVHTPFYGFKCICLLVALQAEVAALDASMQAVQSKLLRAKAKHSRLASVNMQHLSRYKAATNLLSSDAWDFLQNSNGVQRRYCEGRGASGPDVEPVPAVVGSFSSSKRNPATLMLDLDSLLGVHCCRFHTSTAPARLFLLLLLQCERNSVQPADFKLHCLDMYELIAWCKRMPCSPHSMFPNTMAPGSCAHPLEAEFLVQALQAEAEESLRQVNTKLLRIKAAKTILAFEKSTLLTRINRATHSLGSIGKHVQLHQHHTADSTIVNSTPKQGIFGSTAAPVDPRPLSTYAYTASLSAEDILPRLIRNEQKHNRTSKSTSSNMSFAEVNLVRDVIACHRKEVLAGLGAKPTETAWYLFYPREARPGLRLSHSSTLGSTACVLSAVTGWVVDRFEAACLIFLEDHLRAAQSLSTSGCHEAWSLLTDSACPVSTDPELPGGSYSAVRHSKHRGAKVQEAPLHVPAPQLHLLQKHGLMCGENQRVPIMEAVRYMLRGLLLRYHKQLPLAAWQQICVQYMQKLHRAAAYLYSASECSYVSQHQNGEWPDECPWAHVQDVAAQMMNLFLFTVHEVYRQSFKNEGVQSGSGGGF